MHYMGSIAKKSINRYTALDRFLDQIRLWFSSFSKQEIKNIIFIAVMGWSSCVLLSAFF
ncbi:MAG: hypothetical protein WCX27_02785 [Candidatus Paceibacterota bacterium]